MSTASNGRPTASWREVLRPLVCCTLLIGAGYAHVSVNEGQAADAWRDRNLTGAMSRLKQGAFALVDIDVIAKAGAVQAIPDLEKQFALTKDEISKDAIASALVRLGDENVTYSDYLEDQARRAIESDPPYPGGKPAQGESSEFTEWARAQKLTIDTAVEKATRDIPAKVAFLSQGRDRNAVPLLRQALLSRNVMIQTFAAQGLAELRDKASIPFIVQACRRVPADAAAAIASFSLARWDDPGEKCS